MSLGDVNLACARALVDELVHGGVRHACVSPGSRSTPLALALARTPGVIVHVHLDERSSGFVGLGIAKYLREPAAIACTSGTAATELLPAVVEASQSRTPLIVLTADRPPRLRGTGANQTIDQVNLFGRYARAYLEPPVPGGTDDADRWQEAGRRAVLASGGGRPGPVHVNCPFDEPLLPTVVEGTVAVRPTVMPEPMVFDPKLDPEPVDDDVRRAAAELSGARVVVVIGASLWIPPVETVDLARRLGWPVLAEPVSDVRRADPEMGSVLAAGQALIRCQSFLDRHRPEVVLQVGANPASRATQSLVGAANRLVVVDALHLDPDPEGRADLRIRCSPDRLARRLAAGHVEPAPNDWAASWRAVDATVRRVVDESLDADDEPTELRLARDVAAWLPVDGTLFVGNSMPIRDVDYAMAPHGGLRVIANRGASGIDGLVSTAIGVASQAEGTVAALIGDLSFVYDAGALLWNGRRGPDMTFVLPNNGGGAIFSFLGQRDLPELESLFTTPHGLDLGAICVAAGAGHERVERMVELGPALDRSASAGGVRVVEVTIDPVRNHRHRDEVQAAVDRTVE
jgi:2-succinyl-5-enolpyruvyl-6-hydroxy-3-cyclohexene-1-carboxylate synthase